MEIADYLVPIQIDPRLLAQRVMAARDGGFAMFDLVFAKCPHRVAGKLDREAQVIECVDVALRT